MYIKSLYNTTILVNIKYISNEDLIKRNLLKTLIKHYGNRCNRHGYLSNDNISIVEYTIGEIYRDNISFNVLYEGIVELPVIGTILTTKIISNEGQFYLADYDTQKNIGKIFVITKNVLNVNDYINVIIINYFFNDGDSNIYLFAKYIENQNYLIPEIPTKEQCDNYLNIYLKNNINYDNISTTFANSNLETSFDEETINDYKQPIIQDDIDEEIDEEEKNEEEIDEKENIEENEENNEEEIDEEENEEENKLEGGLNEEITSEYIDNISRIELESIKYKLVDNIGGLQNIGQSCFINSILFMLKYNNEFQDYLKLLDGENISEVKKFYETEQPEVFQTALMIHNLNNDEFMNNMDLYQQQLPDKFLNNFFNVINNNNNQLGRVFYNFKRIDFGTIELDDDFKIDEEQREEYNKDYEKINDYVDELKNNDNKFSNILIQKKICMNCNYEMVEVKLINMLDMYYNDEKTLQEVINNNKNRDLDIKCKICNEYNYKEENRYELLHKNLMLLIKSKLDKELNINRTLKINKNRGKIINYILKSPYYSPQSHYRTYNKEDKILYDDDKVYKLNNLTKELVEDIYMIHIKLE